jgi:O-antigen/teichoic acid export membrane protein
VSNLKKSTLWSIVEFAAVVFIQFFVMRYIVLALGVGALGIWAVLMSAAQIASFFDLGASAGTSRFLAMATVDADLPRMESILGAIIYVTIPMYLVLSAILFLPLSHGLGWVLQGHALIEGRALLIFAVASYVSQIIASSFASSLTGLHLGYRKSQIAVAAITLQAILSLILIRRYGLQGLAIAQITNYTFSVLAALSILKWSVGIRLTRLLRCDVPTIRSVMSFGMGVQVSSLAWGAFETSIRFIMSRFGGIDQVGVYEIAYKISSQPRVLAFYMGQSLGPMLASLGVSDKPGLMALYRKVYARLTLFAVLAAVAILILSPLTSLIMLRQFKWTFVLFSALTACGTMGHIIAIPCELTAVSLGVLRYNIAGTLTALGAMLLLGPLLGSVFNGTGVAIAVLLASSLAVSIPVIFNNRMLTLPRFPSFRQDLHLGGLLADLRFRGGA